MELCGQRPGSGENPLTVMGVPPGTATVGSSASDGHAPAGAPPWRNSGLDEGLPTGDAEPTPAPVEPDIAIVRGDRSAMLGLWHGCRKASIAKTGREYRP
jgi:hypothetical protein